jgi:hypothetical protein
VGLQRHVNLDLDSTWKSAIAGSKREVGRDGLFLNSAPDKFSAI